MPEGSLGFVWRVPDSWPMPTQLFRRDGANAICLFALSDGCFAFEALDETGSIFSHRFQPVAFIGEGNAVIMCTWKGNVASMFINGQPLQPFSTAAQPIFVSLTESQSFQFAECPIRPDLVIDRDERFFVETYQDLQNRVRTGTDYEMIRGAGLLRHLLLDARPLIHAVNRRCRLKLRFYTWDFTERPPLDPELQIVALTPIGKPQSRVISITLEEFITAPSIVYKGVDHSVKDVIYIAAHVLGGVHSGRPQNADEERLIEIGNQIYTRNGSLLQFALRQIAEVALVGLSPLVQAVQHPIDASTTV